MSTSSLRLVPMNRDLPTDVSRLLSVVRGHYGESATAFTEERARDSHTDFYFAYQGDDLIGISGINHKTATLAETVKTIVVKEHRGKNLGKLLSQAIEDECRRRGIRKVMTTIYTFNHAMISIKLKQGYTIEGHHPDHEAPGFPEYSLGKFLR